jgi:hypothetical protein
MSTKFFALNQVDSAVITVSTENLQFPKSNIKDARRTKTFRTTAGSGWIVFDFGEAVPIDSFLICDNAKQGFNIDSLTFKVNNVNNWTTPLFSSPVTLDYDFGFGWVQSPTVFNARYARLEFSSSDSYCEIANVFIGKMAEITTDVTYPIDFRQVSLAKISKNRFGQRFIDEIKSIKELSLGLEYLTKDEMDAVFEVFDYCSVTKPLWIVFDTSEITNNNNRLGGYFYLKSDPQFQYMMGNFWKLSMELEEGT